MVTNGTATISVTNNTPSCDVTCNTGYVTSGTYTGTQHTTTVTTGQCSAGTYDITYDWNGGVANSSVLPAGYTQVKYIEFNGAQYIDTGIVLTDSAGIENVMEIQANTTSGFQTWTGFMKVSGTTPRYGINFHNNKWMIGINTTTSNGAALDTSTHTVKFVTGDGVQTLYDTDGTTVLASGTLGSGNALSGNTLSLYIGARNNSDSPVNFVNGRIGRTYLKQNGVMLYNYIPARHGNDVGMYDTVSGMFFTNAAANGQFAAGPDVTIPYPQNYTYGVGATVYGVPVRDHSVFEGWCRTDFPSLTDCAMPHEITTTEHADVTLYAKWSCESGYTLNSTTGECEANRITINYVKGAHGIGSVPQNSSCYYGQTVRLRPGMFESGYVFGGWKMLTNNRMFAPETEIACDYETLGAYSGTITAEGQWDVQQYTVVYDCGYKLDGTTHVSGTAPANNTVYTGQAFYAPNNAGACSYPGFNFVGWRPEGESANWVNGSANDNICCTMGI